MKKVIGFLNSGSQAKFTALVAQFKDGLKEAGHVEGPDVAIEYRWAEGRYSRLPKLAADLVKRRVDVIATTGGVVAAQAAMAATDEIPVLFVSGYDPMEIRFVGRRKGPGPNATGVSVSTTESVPERVHLLRHVFPKTNKIGMLVRPGTDVSKLEKQEAKKANVRVFQASTNAELSKAFTAAAKACMGAVIVCADPFFTSQRDRIVALAAKHGLAAVYAWREYVEAGGLMSFGPSLSDAYRRVGSYTGKILDGTNPSRLPVHVDKISNFKLVINRETAAALGLEIPPKLRKRAEFI